MIQRHAGAMAPLFWSHLPATVGDAESIYVALRGFRLWVVVAIGFSKMWSKWFYLSFAAGDFYWLMTLVSYPDLDNPTWGQA